jgi:hypothetical protein
VYRSCGWIAKDGIFMLSTRKGLFGYLSRGFRRHQRARHRPVTPFRLWCACFVRIEMHRLGADRR